MKKLGLRSWQRTWLWLWLLLKRQLKNPAVILFLLGMPIVAVIIVNIPSMTESEIPRVGIVASSEDNLSERIASRLIEGDYSVDFYRVADYETLKEDVRSGKAECGYLFDENLSEKYKVKDYKNSIFQLQSNTDYVPSMAREIVFSAVFSVYAKDMALDYVEGSPAFSKDVDRAKILVSDRFEHYLDGTITFHMKFSRLDTADSEQVVAITEEPSAFPMRGILAILVYLAGLFGCVQWKMDEEKGVFLTLPYGFRVASRPLYAMIPTILFAVSAELTMAVSHTASYPSELWKMPVYVVAIILFSWLLNLLIPSARVMVSIIPVLLIASMVLCPIFVNVVTTVPIAKYFARLLLPYYYLM